MKTGFINDLPAAEYHASAGTSKSDLDLMARSPLHYWAGKLAPNRTEREETPAMFMGSAVHCAILEPDRFAVDYRVATTDNKRLKAWQDFKKECEADGAFPLTPAEFDQLEAIQMAVYDHPVANYLLTQPGRSELSAFGTDPETGMAIRCRYDRLNDDGVIIDLKKTVDASPAAFAKSAATYRYHVQDAFYSDVYAAVAGVPAKAFLFIAVEEKAPHAVAVYRLRPADVEIGRMLYQHDMQALIRCQADEYWSAYGEEIIPLELPAWARNQATSIITSDY